MSFSYKTFWLNSQYPVLLKQKVSQARFFEAQKSRCYVFWDCESRKKIDYIIIIFLKCQCQFVFW